jgi:hypothetical protein
MTTIGIILTGAVFFALGGLYTWAMCRIAGQADEDMGIKDRVRR